jgi:hypothetical protein
MREVYLRSLEPLVVIVLGCSHRKARRLMKCDVEKG